jgi:hypothetical protein
MAQIIFQKGLLVQHECDMPCHGVGEQVGLFYSVTLGQGTCTFCNARDVDVGIQYITILALILEMRVPVNMYWDWDSLLHCSLPCNSSLRICLPVLKCSLDPTGYLACSLLLHSTLHCSVGTALLHLGICEGQASPCICSL